MWSLGPLVGKYLSGTCASGVHEARLGREHYGGEVHTYSAAFSEADLKAVLKVSDHVVFNSPAQWKRFRPLCTPYRDVKFGLRVNPQHSEGTVPLYDPSAPFSRLGTPRAGIQAGDLEGLSGLHFHNLCEQDFPPLERTLKAFEEKFGDLRKGMLWVNFGGGHHITRPGYQVEALISLVKEFSSKRKLQVYLEPGEAIAYHSGVLVAEVLDVMHNGMPIAVLDTSATCHMPDTLEMPYRAQIIGAGEAGAQRIPTSSGRPVPPRGRRHRRLFVRGAAAGRSAPGAFEDMAYYTMVKTTTFNGVRLPLDRDLEFEQRFDQGGARFRLRGFQRKAVLRFFESEIAKWRPEKARFHVVPVRRTKDVSYGNGTEGPDAILEASSQLERFDGASDPGSQVIYTWPAVDCSGAPEKVIEKISFSVKRILEMKKIPVVLGGEHTVTWGVIKGYLDAGMKDFGVVQIDAHADLRDAYQGDKYSHASVMRRVVEAGVPLVQLGNRAFCEEEREARKKHGVLAFDALDLVPSGKNSIRLPKKFPSKVFFTVDIDGIDPSVLPATGTPVPGG